MLVMPFELCNAPATFLRVMDQALYRVPHVESYVDDILIFSPDFDAHLSHLREVLKHLKDDCTGGPGGQRSTKEHIEQAQGNQRDVILHGEDNGPHCPTSGYVTTRARSTPPRTAGNVTFITKNFLLATNGTQCGSFLQRLCDLPESQAQIQRKSTDGGNENWTRDPWGGNGNGHRYTTMDGLPGRGYRYFLLMVDLFTRYVEVQPLRDQEASSILAAFQQGWVYRSHGMSSIVLTDRGANIDGQVFREFCAKTGIDKGHHPVSSTERRNGGTECSSSEASGKMSSTDLGREPRSPLDAWCTHIHEDERNNHGEYLEALRRKRSELRSIAQENITKI